MCPRVPHTVLFKKSLFPHFSLPLHSHKMIAIKNLLKKMSKLFLLILPILFLIVSTWKARTVLVADAISASPIPRGSFLPAQCAHPPAVAYIAAQGSCLQSSLDSCPWTNATALEFMSPMEQPATND